MRYVTRAKPFGCHSDALGGRHMIYRHLLMGMNPRGNMTCESIRIAFKYLLECRIAGLW